MPIAHGRSYFQTGFAAELWLEIASHLPRGDLSRLGRSTKYLLALTRPRLFRTIDLSSHGMFGGNHHRQLDPYSCYATFRLLITHDSLARDVRELTLPRYSDLTLSECQLLRTQMTAALTKMKSLRKLVFCHIPPFCHAQDSHKYTKANLEFTRILSLVRSTLKELQVLSWIPSGRGLHQFQMDTQSLNLTRILCGYSIFYVCNSDRDGVPEKVATLIKIANLSYRTLTHLNLPVKASDVDCELWKLRFPALRNLEINNIGSDLLPSEGAPTDFFLAHADTLHRIGSYYHGASTKYFLPEVAFTGFGGHLMLRSLSIDGDSLKEIVEEIRDFMTFTLTSLHIYPHDEDSGYDFGLGVHEAMIEGVTEEGDFIPAFPYLEQFRFTLDFMLGCEAETEEGKIESAIKVPGEIVHLLQELAKLPGPKLRKITFSSFWFPVDGPALAAAFMAYPTLEKITIDEKLVGENSTAEEFASAFAAVCPLLNEVAFVPESSNSSRQILHVPIQRNTSDSGAGEACVGKRFCTFDVDSD